jgi:hypothetical protein
MGAREEIESGSILKVFEYFGDILIDTLAVERQF